MKTLYIHLALLALFVITGCNGPGKRELFTVDFHKDTSLSYKFVSSREIEIDIGQGDTKTDRRRDKFNKTTESMEMVVTYTPLEIDDYGLTTIEAEIESVNVERSSRQAQRSKAKDAVESLAGKSFTFTVSPTGSIEDYSQIQQLIQDAGTRAFRQNSDRGRIKEPDMIADFIATQWFLWDSIASIENPAKGIAVGDSWQSKLSVPTPMVMHKARDVTYTFDEIRTAPIGRFAVIKSVFSPSKSGPPA